MNMRQKKLLHGKSITDWIYCMTANPGGPIVILDVGFILYYVVIVSVCPRPGPGVGPQLLD